MTAELIAPDQLPEWVPGRLTMQGPEHGWGTVRGYRYSGAQVTVPPLRDYLIVGYRRGSTAMSRRVDGNWCHERLGPGDVSLLTRADESRWVWSDEIDVVHVYLSEQELARTCQDMYEREVADVRLRDEVRADDPAIHHTAMLIAHEATQGGAGSSLLVDALVCQLSVHILRRHAHVQFREPPGHEGLSYTQERVIRDYVQAHLRERIGLDDLAAAVSLSRFHFARRFRQSTGASPHEFVLRQRVAHARTLLTRTDAPLSAVALACGFADQSHLNRVFKAHVGTTPGRFRERR